MLNLSVRAKDPVENLKDKILENGIRWNSIESIYELNRDEIVVDLENDVKSVPRKLKMNLDDGGVLIARLIRMTCFDSAEYELEVNYE